MIIFQSLLLIVAAIVGSVFTYYFLTPSNIMPSDKFDVFVQTLIILLGIMGALGFVIYQLILRLIRDKVREDYRTYYIMSIANLNNDVSVIIWRLFLIEESRKSGTEFLGWLIDLAIEGVRKNLDEYLRKLPQDEKTKVEEIWYKANLIYYYAEKVRIGLKLNDDEKSEVIRMAYEVQEYVNKNRDKFEKFYEFIESSLWALYWLGEKKSEVIKEFKKLLENESIPKSWRDDIKSYWESKGIKLNNISD